jgi:(4-(4-[2-(gamma-L-glutamylamino)ethyl]phenoxymethyl)furan-2-yl)methanamine synthase
MERHMRSVIGWDVGGAHLKAARAENGRIVDAIQIASPLRLGLDRLAQAFAEAKARMGEAHLHAVTMTGELADTFSSRAEGVEKLSALAVRELAPAEVSLYAGRVGFIAPRDAPRHVEDIASANWFASAALAARAQRTALLVDIGSTTTDLVPVIDGAVAARGYTDAERLAAGELVYTGLVRSFVMAVAERAPFAGRWSPLINENFATMADVYRILEQLPDGADQMTTADGRAKTIEASRARLARMVGCDVDDADPAAWRMLAQWFAERQIRTIVDGAMLVLSSARLPVDAPVLGAGIGEAIVQEVARRLERPYVSFGSILDVAPAARVQASHCAPAAALAVLASMSTRGAVETESGRAVG